MTNVNIEVFLLAAALSTWADWATIVMAAALVPTAAAWIWQNIPELFACLGCRVEKAKSGSKPVELDAHLQESWWRRTWFDLRRWWPRRWCEGHWCYGMAGRRWVNRHREENPGKIIEKVTGKPPCVTVTYQDPGSQTWTGNQLIAAATLTDLGNGWQTACNACSWQSETLPREEAEEALKNHEPSCPVRVTRPPTDARP